MKIVHVVRSLEFGGAEKLVLALAGRQKMARGDEVEIACLKSGGALVAEARSLSLPVKVTGLGRIRYLSGIRNLRRYLEQRPPDVVHTHNMLSHVHAAPAARTLGIPVVHTKHGRAVTSFSWSPALRRHLYGLADALVAVSGETADIFAERTGISREKIRVVYNGIDTSRYADAEPAGPDMPGMADIEKGTVVFGSVSRLDPVKDHRSMITAFAEAAELDPSCVLLIIGEGPERESIERLAAGLSISGRVILPGFTSEVPRYIAAMSLFLQPSLDEGLSLTILEAAACGIPVLATSVGGTPEIIENGVTGTLVEPGDPEALAEAMKRFITEPRPFREMAGEARRKVQEVFSLESMESAYRSIYDEITTAERND